MGLKVISLKKLINENVLGSLPSSKLMKMKWNPVTESAQDDLEHSELEEAAFSMNEGFATWKMQFAPMNLSGVKLDPKKTYTVKARSTVEAIKKASKMAGLSGDSWMATQTHKLIKVG